MLDEPAAVQSDPTLLNLQLRALGKEAAGVKMQALGSIPHKAPDRCGGGMTQCHSVGSALSTVEFVTFGAKFFCARNKREWRADVHGVGCVCTSVIIVLVQAAAPGHLDQQHI